MQFLRDILKKVLPSAFVDWYRRRRATRRYLHAIGEEIVERNTRMDLEELEGKMAAKRDGFQERVIRDVLERTELILQELDRRIEGVTARHGNEIRQLRSEVAELRQSVDRLRAELPTPTDQAGRGTPAAAPAGPALDR